jgi:hypothetical protein
MGLGGAGAGVAAGVWAGEAAAASAVDSADVLRQAAPPIASPPIRSRENNLVKKRILEERMDE